MNPKVNQFPGVCRNCGGNIKSGEGYLLGRKKSGKGWDMSHQEDCTPKSDVERVNYEEQQEHDAWHTPGHEGEIDKDYHA